MISGAWRAALRRGAVALTLGAVLLLASWPADAETTRVLLPLGLVLLTLGALITVATRRAASAER